MDILKKAFHIIIQNIVTIVAIVAGILSFASPDDKLPYIVSMLIFIASTLLIEKVTRLDSIDKDIKNMKEKIALSNQFIYCSTSQFWVDALKMSDAVFISGGSLYHVLSEKSSDFEGLLKNGRKVEVVLMKPFSDATKLLYNNVIKEVPTLKDFNNNIMQTLVFLCKYKKKYPEQLSIRMNDQVPSFGLMAVSKHGSPQKIQVNLYSEKVSFDKRLSMVIDNTLGASYFAFEYFCHQIEFIRMRLDEMSIEDIESFIEKHSK